MDSFVSFVVTTTTTVNVVVVIDVVGLQLAFEVGLIVRQGVVEALLVNTTAIK